MISQTGRGLNRHGLPKVFLKIGKLKIGMDLKLGDMRGIAMRCV